MQEPLIQLILSNCERRSGFRIIELALISGSFPTTRIPAYGRTFRLHTGGPHSAVSAVRPDCLSRLYELTWNSKQPWLIGIVGDAYPPRLYVLRPPSPP